LAKAARHSPQGEGGSTLPNAMRRGLMLALFTLGSGAICFGLWWSTRELAPPASDTPATHSASTPARLEAALDQLHTNPARARATLANLRAELFALPPETASAAIVDFLARPDRDAPTGLTFTLAEDGTLASAPTLRVALIDWLGQLDPPRAATFAETLLESPTTPAEWALCLRNHAWAHPELDDRDFLRARTEALIEHEPWRREPSAAYLEAFDVLVHARATESTPVLARLLADPPHRATRHAAFLTLDRLLLARPEDMLARLASPDLRSQVPAETRAQWLARADLSQPDQRAHVMRFLLDPDRSAAELEAFTSVYPNANFMVSDNLLTDFDPPSGTELAARDRAALEIVNEWLDQPRFATRRDTLERMKARLESFLPPADAADP